MNYPVQGGAADVMHRAMRLLFERSRDWPGNAQPVPRFYVVEQGVRTARRPAERQPDRHRQCPPRRESRHAAVRAEARSAFSRASPSAFAAAQVDPTPGMARNRVGPFGNTSRKASTMTSITAIKARGSHEVFDITVAAIVRREHGNIGKLVHAFQREVKNFSTPLSKKNCFYFPPRETVLGLPS
jgi:hypothetical protein